MVTFYRPSLLDNESKKKKTEKQGTVMFSKGSHSGGCKPISIIHYGKCYFTVTPRL